MLIQVLFLVDILRADGIVPPAPLDLIKESILGKRTDDDVKEENDADGLMISDEDELDIEKNLKALRVCSLLSAYHVDGIMQHLYRRK